MRYCRNCKYAELHEEVAEIYCLLDNKFVHIKYTACGDYEEKGV